MSTTEPLTFHARASNYARQRGRDWDPHRMTLDQCTPAQRRRLMRKERRTWAAYAEQHPYTGWDCDVCGLPDLHRGAGDGIGSCDCPRCECGEAARSQFCTCRDYDDGDERPDYYDDDDAAAEIERRFLGDLGHWQPTGLQQPTATEEP